MNDNTIYGVWIVEAGRWMMNKDFAVLSFSDKRKALATASSVQSYVNDNTPTCPSHYEVREIGPDGMPIEIKETSPEP